MGLDYYNILKLNGNATMDDVKKAYKRLARVFHPDKNPNNRQESEARFKLVNESYDVLADPEKRKIYDEYCLQSHGYTGRNDVLGERSNESFWQPKPRVKAAPVETDLFCSLEDLYNGTEKKRRIARTVLDNHGYPMMIEEIVKIGIKPGWKKGTRITFPEMGNEEDGIIPADLVFVIDEKPHGIFKRDGDNLLIEKNISLLQALAGTPINLETLDKRHLDVSDTNRVLKPGSVIDVPNEGMPIESDPRRRGNLRMRVVEVVFPSHLTSVQRSYLRTGLRGV